MKWRNPYRGFHCPNSFSHTLSAILFSLAFAILPLCPLWLCLVLCSFTLVHLFGRFCTYTFREWWRASYTTRCQWNFHGAHWYGQMLWIMVFITWQFCQKETQLSMPTFSLLRPVNPCTHKRISLPFSINSLRLFFSSYSLVVFFAFQLSP